MGDIGEEVGLGLSRLPLLGIESAQLRDHVRGQVGQRRPGEQQPADGGDQRSHGPGGGLLHPGELVFGATLCYLVYSLGSGIHLLYTFQSPVASLLEGLRPSFATLYSRPEAVLVLGGGAADLGRPRSFEVSDTELRELVYLLSQSVVCRSATLSGVGS